MDMSINNTLEFMVNTESIKCANWSDFEHSSSFLKLPKVIT